MKFTVKRTLPLLGLLALSLRAQPAVQVIASGLDNPRGLAFGPEGALYVAEAGRGGAGPCITGPEGPVCYGATGALTRLWRGGIERVLTGLPSLADPNDGSGAVGPHDLSFLGRGGAYIAVGLGADPKVRQDLPAGATFGHLLKVSAGGQWKSVADVAAHEAATNPDGGQVDSNPYAVHALPGGYLVADAGANALLHVAANGQVSTVAVFPVRLVTPPFPGPPNPFPMQAVPTAVTVGPDGAIYVGELTGFPFPVGGARVYRLAPGQPPEVYVQGLTNIIDIAFDGAGNLYVLEIAKDSLLAPPFGALKRVSAGGGSIETILDTGLFLPTGLAIGADGAIYISNCGACAAGQGQVLRVMP